MVFIQFVPADKVVRFHICELLTHKEWVPLVVADQVSTEHQKDRVAPSKFGATYINTTYHSMCSWIAVTAP